jgi:hypothetical protein
MIRLLLDDATRQNWDHMATASKQLSLHPASAETPDMLIALRPPKGSWFTPYLPNWAIEG